VSASESSPAPYLVSVSGQDGPGIAERGSADAALDTAIERFRWQRRIAGDARKRNRILQFLYKGA
jgi:hypothetical protein